MKLRNAAVLAIAGWYLMLPATAPQSGSANADPYPIASIWGSYKTREQCELERQNLITDPVVGARMEAAKCLPSDNNQQHQPADPK